jgi:WD40 repeat protein
VLGIGFSPDGAQLATVPFDGPVELWDLNSKEKLAALGGTGGYDTSDAIFSPNGQFLAADLATGLFLWRIADGELVWNEIKNSMAFAFSPDGRYLAYSDIDEGSKVFLSSPDGAQTIRIMEGTPGGPVWELIFSPDSSMLASTDGAELRIWGVEDGRLLYVGKPACP